MMPEHTTHFDDCGCRSAQYEATIAEMLEMLKRFEWVESNVADHYWNMICGVCYGLKSNGHKNGCKLAALIAKAEAE